MYCNCEHYDKDTGFCELEACVREFEEQMREQAEELERDIEKDNI